MWNGEYGVRNGIFSRASSLSPVWPPGIERNLSDSFSWGNVLPFQKAPVKTLFPFASVTGTRLFLSKSCVEVFEAFLRWTCQNARQTSYSSTLIFPLSVNPEQGRMFGLFFLPSTTSSFIQPASWRFLSNTEETSPNYILIQWAQLLPDSFQWGASLSQVNLCIFMTSLGFLVSF